MNKRVIIIGATSGIGREVANIYIAQGWKVGVAGRRAQELEALRLTAPEQVFTQVLDVTEDNAQQKLHTLIEQIGSMDVFLLSSGIGKQNYSLQTDIELATAATNVEGFIRMTNAAFHYFEKQGHGHLAIISSIAGTKGLGAAAAYSATKRFQSIYFEALAQMSSIKRKPVDFTAIKPGFIATDFIKYKYFMTMSLPYAGKRIVRAIEKRKNNAVIDWRWKIAVALLHLIPTSVWRKIRI